MAEAQGSLNFPPGDEGIYRTVTRHEWLVVVTSNKNAPNETANVLGVSVNAFEPTTETTEEKFHFPMVYANSHGILTDILDHKLIFQATTLLCSLRAIQGIEPISQIMPMPRFKLRSETPLS